MRPGAWIVLLCSGCAPSACAEPAPEPPPSAAPVAVSEPISVRVGGREVLVTCSLACGPTRAELTSLRDRCVRDPLSTPHHVATSPALIGLGCCTEAEAAYRDACGGESLEACISRWSAECASGRVRSP